MSTRMRGGLCLIALTVMLSGCGGGSSTASTTSGSGSSGSSGSGSSGSNAIVGVATPSNVAVVTATNAN